MAVIGSHSVVKRFWLDDVVVGWGWVGEQFEKVVFEGEQVWDDERHLVEFVGFPKWIGAALYRSFVAFQENGVLELLYPVLLLILPTCIQLYYTVLINQYFFILQSRKITLASHKCRIQQLLPRIYLCLLVKILVIHSLSYSTQKWLLVKLILLEIWF